MNLRMQIVHHDIATRTRRKPLGYCTADEASTAGNEHTPPVNQARGYVAHRISSLFLLIHPYNVSNLAPAPNFLAVSHVSRTKCQLHQAHAKVATIKVIR